MVKKVLFVTMVLVALFGVPQRAQAQDDTACATNLLDCYNKTAKIDSVWYRWAGGIDCELRFTNCVRRALIGR
jgi:hypothetical protein